MTLECVTHGWFNIDSISTNRHVSGGDSNTDVDVDVNVNDSCSDLDSDLTSILESFVDLGGEGLTPLDLFIALVLVSELVLALVVALAALVALVLKFFLNIET